MIHELKCWPIYYRAVVNKVKTFEVRRNDRGFQVGDKLHLREWNPEQGAYTGQECYADVVYMLVPVDLPGMLAEDTVVMGISVLAADSTEALLLDACKTVVSEYQDRCRIKYLQPWERDMYEQTRAALVEFYRQHAQTL